MPEPIQKNPRKRAPTGVPESAPDEASKDEPKGKPAPRDDDGEQCESNDGKPSDGPRKPKCHEGYPEQQPTDTDRG